MRPLRPVVVRLLCIIGLFTATGQVVSAQAPDPSAEFGILPYQSYNGGNIDSINLLNDTLNVRIPLTSYPQRGGKLKTAFSIVYMQPTLVYVYDGPNCNPSRPSSCNQDWHLTQSNSYPFGAGIDIVPENFPAAPTFSSALNAWQLATSDGSTHLTAPNTSSTVLTIDSTAWLVTTSTNGRCSNGSVNQVATATDNTGNKYSFSSCSGPYPMFAQDTNGNELNYNSSTGTFSDTLGRLIPSPMNAEPTSSGLVSTSNFSGCTGSLPTIGAALWNIPGLNGGTTTYKVCYAAVTINLPGCSTDGSTRCVYEPTGSRIQSIVLPNGTAWTFGYDSSSSPSQYAYGDLISITFPTGGTISYVWGPLSPTFPCEGGSIQFMRRGVYSRTINSNDGTGGHEWTYNQTIGSGTYPPIQTTVVDPLGNQIVHTFSGINSTCHYSETETQYYQGSSTILKTTTTQYLQAGGDLPSVVTTTWANGQVSQVQNDWGTDAGNGLSYGNATATRYYDYGTGGPGALLRQTKTAYEYQGSGSYKTNNLVTLPSTVTTYDGSGTQRALTTYSYDQPPSPSSACGNLTAVSRWLNTNGTYLTATNVYNSTGTISSSKDPKGNSTTYGYSSAYEGAYLTSVTNALNQTTNYTYDFNTGLLASTTDPNSQTTSYAYDSMSRSAQTTYPGGGQTTYCYTDEGGSTCTASGPPYALVTTQKMSSSQNLTTTDVYDGVGRLSEHELTSDPAGTDITTITYDALGRVASVSNPYRSGGTVYTTTYAYDPLNRTTQVTEQDGSTVLTSYTGRATLVQDEGNGAERVQRISQVDGLGRLASVCEVSSTTLPGNGGTPSACGLDISGTGFLTSYQYDALDDLTSVTQSGMNPRTFAYDSLSRLSSSVNPESNTVPGTNTTVATTYSYDANGNLSQKIAPEPNQQSTATVTTTYSYDALNRMTGKTYSDSTPSASYSYDQSSWENNTLSNPIGRLTSETTSWPTGRGFSYDPMGRVATSVQLVPFQSSPYVLAYTYDDIGDLTNATNGVGITFTYTYNNAAQLTNVMSSDVDSQHPGTLFTPSTYDAAGQLLTATLGNGLSETRTYDTRLRPLSLAEGSVYSFSIPSTNGYAPDSDILAANDSANGNWGYAYDQLNRLASATQGSTAYTYAYDRYGNRINQEKNGSCASGPVFCVTYDANNRINNGAQVYDTAGNVIMDGLHNYHYDAENRLDQVDGGVTACYVYDASGWRVRKMVGPTGCPLNSAPNSGAIYNLSDLNNRPVTELLGPTFAWSRGEVYSAGRHVATYANGTTYFDHADWLGTERARTAISGTSCETVTSLPFGDLLTTNGGCGDPSPIHFTGRERDTDSGLDNLLARYSSSTVGRFMSADKFGGLMSEPQSLNRYAYVINNPLKFVDPSGYWHCVWDDGSADDTQANGGASYQECADQGGAGWVSDNGDSLAGSACSYGTCAASLPAPTDSMTSLADLPSQYTLSSDSSTDTSDAVGLDIWHNSADCPNCGAIWQSTAGGMNAITLGYTALYGGAFLGASGAPYVASIAARGIGWGYAALGGGSAVVLGGYPDYIQAAQEMGARALNMPNSVWNALSVFGENWTAEQAFIDTAMSRGYSISLAPGAGGGVNFWLEMQYLREVGVDPASLPVVTVPR